MAVAICAALDRLTGAALRLEDWIPALAYANGDSLTVELIQTGHRRYTEPFFEDSIVSSAIDTVAARGVSYFSAAGNDGNLAYENLAPNFNTPSTKKYAVGDRLEIIVPHCDPVVNLYDQIYGTRKDRVEVVWPISARGHSQ